MERSRQHHAESEERYRRLIDAISGYDYCVRLEDGRAVETIHGANCAVVTGYTAEAFKADPMLWIAIVVPEDRNIVEQQIARIHSGDGVAPIEHRIKRKDGQIRWVENAMVPLHDQDGQLIAYEGLVRDITRRKHAEAKIQQLNEELERKKAEEQLRESEERYRLLADHSADFVNMNDVTGQRLYISPSYFRATGWTREEVESTDWRTRIHPDDVAKVELAHEANLRGKTARREYRTLCKDGTWIWVESRSQPILGADGEVEKIVVWARDITERKMADGARQRAESLQRNTLENISDAVFLTNDAGEFEYVCPNTNIIFGYDDTEVREMGHISRVLGDDVFDPEALEQAGEIRNIDRTVQDKDGWSHDLLVNVRRVSINGGTRLYVCRDITEIKKAHEELREREERLRAILNTAADAIITIDQRGVVASINPVTEQMFGYKQDELVGQNIKILMPQPYRDEHDGYLARYQQTGKAHVVCNRREFVGQRKDGSTFPIDVTVSEVGQLGIFTGIVREITERKAVEAALQREHEFAESLTNTAQNIILVLDTEGRVVQINPYMEELTGWTLDEAKGRDWFDTFLPGRDRQPTRDLFGRALGDTRTRGHVNSIVTKDGRERQIAWWDAPLTDRDGSLIGLIATGYDVTDRRELQKQVLEATTAEQRRIGHDLHDGLTQQITGLGLLARGIQNKLAAESSPLADRQERLCQAIQEAWEHSRQLSHGLLVVDPDAHGLMSALETLAQETTDLSQTTCEFICKEPVLFDDNATATHLYRITQEALHNAIRHGRPTRIGVMLTEDDDGITLTVEDDGKGMDTAVTAESSGMGLRIMQYRSELIGASLDIHSIPGDGTILTCTVPRSQ